MTVSRSKGRVTVVTCKSKPAKPSIPKCYPPNCPRVSVASNVSILRDDYKGSIKMGKGMLRRLIAF